MNSNCLTDTMKYQARPHQFGKGTGENQPPLSLSLNEVERELARSACRCSLPSRCPPRGSGHRLPEFPEAPCLEALVRLIRGHENVAERDILRVSDA